MVPTVLPDFMLPNLANAKVGIIGEFEYILGKENMGWPEHEAAAAKWGGHIVSIADEDEYKFVRKLFSGDQWLGAIRLRQDNGCGAEHWKWSDGTPWAWHKWADGEPNNAGGREDRVQMYPNGLWNDIPGTTRRPAVYKRPKGAGEKEAQRDAEAKKMKDGNARLLDFIACLERGVRGTHS